MHTTPAADTAAAESATWANIAVRWSAESNFDVWQDLPGAEALVIPDVDVRDDLERRARRWGYRLADGDLGDVAMFAAALARAEADAWAADDGVLATQAYEDRRFLAADRIVPWAVPWLLAASRCFPDLRTDASETAAALLRIGEQHRLAPSLAGNEGLRLPGHDGYGPAGQPGELTDRICSLWGGLVVFRRSLISISGEEIGARRPEARWFTDVELRGNIATWYEIGAARWRCLAEQHPGTGAYWLDLARRASETAEIAK